MRLVPLERTSLRWPDSWSRLLDFDLEPSGMMRVEEFEEEGNLVIRAEIPDIDPDKDVDVSMTDHVLHIHAERQERTERRDKKSYRTEFRYGSFDRDVTLPETARKEDIKASYHNGILEVRIPCEVSKDEQAVKIPVTTS